MTVDLGLDLEAAPPSAPVASWAIAEPVAAWTSNSFLRQPGSLARLTDTDLLKLPAAVA